MLVVLVICLIHFVGFIDGLFQERVVDMWITTLLLQFLPLQDRLFLIREGRRIGIQVDGVVTPKLRILSHLHLDIVNHLRNLLIKLEEPKNYVLVGAGDYYVLLSSS